MISTEQSTGARAAPHHSVLARFGLLLGMLLVGFGITYWFIRHLEVEESAELISAARSQQASQLDHWLTQSRRSLENLTRDFTRHHEVTRILSGGQRVAAAPSLAGALENSGADVIWLAAPDGQIWLAQARPDIALPGQTPLPREQLQALFAGARPPRVFTETGSALLELCGEPVFAGRPTAGSDAPPKPVGWVVMGRHWGSAHLATLASLTEAEVRLDPPGTAVVADVSPDSVVVTRLLTDWQGKPLRQLFVRRATPELALFLRNDARQTRTFIGFGLLLAAGLGLALYGWVLRPLRHIRESLVRGDPAVLGPVRGETTEFGTLAGLVESSFAQRDALKREIDEHTRTAASLRLNREELRRTLDERARLARDLHDGVIQSLYASGMSLAGIRSLLRTDQAEAAVRLEQTRAALNESIRDMRNFITGLEPETLREQSFSQAIEALLSFMQSVRSYEAKAEIDDQAASRLTLAQRLHALQVAREAVSNALRHGHAAHVSVALRTVDATLVFEIRDDGRGFVPGETPSGQGSGHGLANFKRRARELGADFVLQSELGRGTTVQLIFANSS